MNLKEYKVAFAIGVAILLLLSAAPAMSVYISIPNDTTRFSQFWVLGPKNEINEYPLEVKVGSEYELHLGVGNQMHTSSYYMINVKFRTEAESLPAALNSTPSTLTTLYQYEVFLPHGASWDTLFTFGVTNTSSIVDNSITVYNVTINGLTFPLNSSTIWNSPDGGFFYQVLFELWRYDPSTNLLQFDNHAVWVWIKLNGMPF
jgi:hypothetical protein